MIRANAFQECGWSPTWTLTEDFALGMELKKRNWQCRYMREFLAVGEAPIGVRNCFQQKSRWCKVNALLCFKSILHFREDCINQRLHCCVCSSELMPILPGLRPCQWSSLVSRASVRTALLLHCLAGQS